MNRLELMEKLYCVTAKQLIDRLRSGEATAADIKNAIQFLKDNSITAAGDNYPLLPEIETALAEAKILPFPQ